MKRKWFVPFILILAAAAVHGEDAAAKRILLPSSPEYDGDWFVDATGAPASSARYAGVTAFSEGLAAVYVSGRGWGYVDALEKFVVQPKFYLAKPFSGGLAAVQQEENGPWGYIDTAGRFVVEPRYQSAYQFQEGFAHVWTGEEVLLIDRTGRPLALPSSWKVAGSQGFSEGLAPVVAEGTPKQAGFVDTSGKIVLVLKDCSFAEEFHEGLAVVTIGKKYGYVDKSGKLVIPAAFDYAKAFHEKRAAVTIGKKEGYIDPQGRFTVKAEWDACGDFSQGLAPVAQGEVTSMFSEQVWRYIDADGKTVIPGAYTFARPFREGLAMVGIGNVLLETRRYFYIDRNGRPLPKTPFLALDARTDFSSKENGIGLSSEGGWKVDNGVYAFTGKDAPGSRFRTGRMACTDFYTEVKVVSLAGTDANAMAGILFKVDEENEEFYLFGLYMDGQCTVEYKAKDKDWENVGMGSGKGVKGANTLQVACRGDAVDCFLNGAKALSFKDTRIGAEYRYLGLYTQYVSTASFDDLAIRAIGRAEHLAGLDPDPTPAELQARLNSQVSAFPDSPMRIFLPPDPRYPGEMYLAFDGLGTGAYRTMENAGAEGPLAFSFVGQSLYKSLKKFELQFPSNMPADKEGRALAFDAGAYPPRIYLPLLASSVPSRAADLAAFLGEWNARSVDFLRAQTRIQKESRFVLGEDPLGIVMDVVALGGIASTLWGFVDWGIGGAFGERQSWEVWGGLGALASYYVFYMPIASLVIEPLYKSEAVRKAEELKLRIMEEFRAQAARMRDKHPDDVVAGRPEGAEGQ